jgi:hypothetical protein
MNAMNARLETLLFASTCESFSEVERMELNALLRDSAGARAFAARHLTIDALLTENLSAREHTASFQPTLISTGRTISRPRWFARAAAWIGAFHLFSDTAKATSIILMKKTVTSVTAAILIIGGSGIYAIHHQNESSHARVANMETEIQKISDQLGIKTNHPANSRTTATNSQKPVSITQVIAIYGGDNSISMQEAQLLEQFQNQLAAMDAESLKNLLLDAEKVSNPINGRVAETIMKALISKDPAEATQIASQLIGRAFEFHFLLSHSAADAFKSWLAKDPTPADAWYVATAAAGGLNSKGIAPNGLEKFTIERSFARLRFAAQVVANPAEATTMLATMLPADVTDALNEVTDPNALRQILPKLSPEQKIPAAEGAIKAMAANDPNTAFSWAKSLGMADRERDTLMASGIESAVASGKIDLSGVAKWAKTLDLDADRLAKMQVNAAEKSSIAPGGDERAVAWDRVPNRIEWLRKEAPPESANKMVGEYLGQLAYGSRDPDQSFIAYEQEIARQGNPDPALTIAYARWLGMLDLERFSSQALKYLRKLPASEERDNTIEMIEMNR